MAAICESGAKIFQFISIFYEIWNIFNDQEIVWNESKLGFPNGVFGFLIVQSWLDSVNESVANR